MANRNKLVSVSDTTNHFSWPRFSIPHRMPLVVKNHQISVSAPKINPWLDSMRSSSPTNHHSSSNLTHLPPSALQMFEHITEASKGKQIVVFLDYDGTLSPIVEDPDRAFMSDEMRGAVREIAKHFPTAIVTGRGVDKVYSFVKLAELYYAGSHGLDIKGPAKGQIYKGNHSVLYQPGSNFLPMIDEVYKALVEKTRTTAGASVENNKFCVSVHFRRVDEKKWPELAERVREVLAGYPKLRLTQGRKVLEIRPSINWDKGKAVEFLLESLGYANSDNVMPIYIGDDRTDEDAFKVLRNKKQGFGILVSKVGRETNASYTLRDPSEVKCFLQRLVERKPMPRRGSCFRTSLGIKKTWEFDTRHRNGSDDQISREFPRQFFARRF